MNALSVAEYNSLSGTEEIEATFSYLDLKPKDPENNATTSSELVFYFDKVVVRDMYGAM